MVENNRRKTPRVNYACQLTMWIAAGGYDTVLAQASNIGGGGLCVRMNQSMAQGTKIDIQIDFDDSSPLFRCKGTVVRCQPESKGVYNTGIQFVSLSEGQQDFINAKIAQLLQLEKKET